MKSILVSICFLLIATVAFGQYDNCALAGANPVTISMANTCGSWTSNTFNLSNGTNATAFPNGDCSSNTPVKDYWVSFIMPPNTTPKFSIEFEIVGSCTSQDLDLIGISALVGSCASFPVKEKNCNFCSSSACSKQTLSNAAFTPGTQIYLQIYDNNDANCDIRMHIYPSPAEDDCITSIPFDDTKTYCNKNASNKNEGITSPGICGPNPLHKNAITSIDNAMWFAFTVTAADPQPYSITMSNIACTGGQKSMQMMIYDASCGCASPCFMTCTAQEEPATTTLLTIFPGVNYPGYAIPVGNYYLVIDGGNGADCQWNIAKNIELPVTMLSFDLTKYKSSVKLNWQVIQEVDNKGYVLQRSSDGVNFIDIAYVNGKGNYTGMLNYEFTDYNPLKSANYYRLKQEDIDGGFQYSVIRITTMDATIAVFPNPFSDNFHLSVSEALDEYRYTILNVTGQTIESSKCKEDNLISLTNHPNGMYYILVYNLIGEVVLNQSLVKF